MNSGWLNVNAYCDDNLLGVIKDVRVMLEKTGGDTYDFPSATSEILEKNISNLDLERLSTPEMGLEEISYLVADYRFSDFTLTIYKDDLLRVDINYWANDAIAVHAHNFKGAFCAISGSRLHTVYEYNETNIINDNLSIGELTIKSNAILNKNDVHPIYPNLDLVHDFVYLERPAVSLVIRTQHPSSWEGKRFIQPGIAYKTSAAAYLAKTYSYLDYMLLFNIKIFINLIEKVLAESRPENSIDIIYRYYSVLNKNEMLMEIFEKVIRKVFPVHYEIIIISAQHKISSEIVGRESKRIDDKVLKLTSGLWRTGMKRVDIGKLAEDSFGINNAVDSLDDWLKTIENLNYSLSESIN